MPGRSWGSESLSGVSPSNLQEETAAQSVSLADAQNTLAHLVPHVFIPGVGREATKPSTALMLLKSRL